MKPILPNLNKELLTVDHQLEQTDLNTLLKYLLQFSNTNKFIMLFKVLQFNNALMLSKLLQSNKSIMLSMLPHHLI